VEQLIPDRGSRVSTRPLWRLYNFVHQAPHVGGGDIDGHAAEPHPRQAVASDPSSNTDGASGAGDKPEADLRQLEARVRISNNPMGEGREFNAGAHRRPVDVGRYAAAQHGPQPGRTTTHPDPGCPGRVGH
jgi:hypothetical protein